MKRLVKYMNVVALRKYLLVACVLMTAGVASAAGTWNFGGFGASTTVFGEDTTAANYELYAILEDDTSASELSKRFAGSSFDEFKTEADANALKSTATASGTSITLDGVFADGNSRVTYLDDDGISHGLYAVIVHDNEQFKVMESTFFVPPKGYLVYTGGEWANFAIPEPTSGLLILLGVAGLALRRQKQG